MAFVAVPNVIKTVVRYNFNDRIYTNTLWWHKSGGSTVAQAELLVDAVRAAYSTYVLPNQSSDVGLLNVLGYDMSAIDGFVVSSGAAGPNVGGVISPGFPGNVTVAISLRTANRGKSGRGRLYHIGLADNQVTYNTLNSGVAGGLTDAYLDMKNDVETTVPYLWGVVSFQRDGVALDPGNWQQITNITVDPQVDSQSRRIKP